MATAATVAVALEDDQTRLLLHEVPRAYSTQINDALLAALALAVTDWTGRDDVLVDLEGHGREETRRGGRSVADRGLVHDALSRRAFAWAMATPAMPSPH